MYSVLNTLPGHSQNEQKAGYKPLKRTLEHETRLVMDIMLVPTNGTDG
jgi:hypothetical protein